jgi:hypothetical protein
LLPFWGWQQLATVVREAYGIGEKVYLSIMSRRFAEKIKKEEKKKKIIGV